MNLGGGKVGGDINIPTTVELLGPMRVFRAEREAEHSRRF